MISASFLETTLGSNVFASINLMQLSTKLMSKQGSGSIIYIPSIISIDGNKGQLTYSASRGAVITTTESVSKELTQHDIRVNAIAPGIIDTDLLENTDKTVLESMLEGAALERIGAPKNGECLPFLGRRPIVLYHRTDALCRQRPTRV